MPFTKAPWDYLFALAISATVVGTAFLVKPAETKWIVVVVGVVMLVGVLAAAVWPSRSNSS
ncbi:MAG: hypothetical protein ACRDYC_10100 [Acidimicrobiales bacterium]